MIDRFISLKGNLRYNCKITQDTRKKIDPKKSNKSECRVYPNQAVPVIPQIRDML
jgi:hypothetical protein